jgi:hypothetical protein
VHPAAIHNDPPVITELILRCPENDVPQVHNQAVVRTGSVMRAMSRERAIACADAGGRALRVLWELREDPAPICCDPLQRTGGIS